MIQALINRFSALNGQMVCVCIKHMLYGSQKIKCALRPLWDGVRIGLIINNEPIYITTDELTDVSINDNEYVIKSEIMELQITA